MTDEKYIKWILEGKAAWNKRRELHSFRPRFSSVDFLDTFRQAEQLDHNGRVPLNEFDLSYAVFHGTRLDRVDFQGTNLRGSCLLGTRLHETDFSQADLTDAEFGVGYLGEANLAGANLLETNLVGMNLTGADLGWSQFWQAKLFPGSTQGVRSVSRSETRNKDQRIERVADLIKVCFEMRNRYKGLTLYFRGERNSAWDLRPSVMRSCDDGSYKLRAHEGEMLRDLISRRPEDFGGTTSALEQMVIAQHHGLKTRLLDVTRNPCVALFSACDRRDPAGTSLDNTMDGRLHVFAVQKELVKPFDSDTVSIISNYAKLDRGYQNLLVGRTGKESQAEDPKTPLQYIYPEAMRHLYHLIRQEKPQFEKLIDPRDFLRVFVVEPKQSFERIRAQEGAFIMSAFHERFEREQILSRTKNLPLYEYDTIIVPCEKKKLLLDELSLLHFTRETLYPSLDEVANRITQFYL
ncbi:MAG: pentapeptide repeat-containing protein [Caldilineaceae bacterium]|nr:pentapeptide repeat-containing protein [Caldilineaceae bacterium]